MERMIGLLDIMTEDAQDVDKLYQPTNYFSYYSPKIMRELKKTGIENLRSKKNSFLSHFGASDSQMDYFRVPKYCNYLPERFREYLVGKSLLSKEELQHLAYHQASYLDKIYNVNKLDEVSVSLEGNPADVFYMDSKPYTISFLKYYLQYIYIRRFLDLDRIKIFVDHCCGMSKTSEIIHKLHPDVMILMFDIVPTVYITERYMKSVFPREVYGYATTKPLKNLEYDQGKIYVFPNWKIPILDTLPSVDVFMDSAGFQEMEYNVVANYLSFVKGKARYIYLRERTCGVNKAKKGKYGSINPVQLLDYISLLNNYEIINMENSIIPLVSIDYTDMIMKKR